MSHIFPYHKSASFSQEGPKDFVLLIAGRDLCVEVKARADGFRELYSWLEGRDVLIVNADRQEPLGVLRLSLVAELAGQICDVLTRRLTVRKNPSKNAI